MPLPGPCCQPTRAHCCATCCLHLARSVLHLYDNPLDFLPEISPCSELTHLTVANLRITADQVRSCVGVAQLWHMPWQHGLCCRCTATAPAMHCWAFPSRHSPTCVPAPLLQAYTKVRLEKVARRALPHAGTAACAALPCKRAALTRLRLLIACCVRAPLQQPLLATHPSPQFKVEFLPPPPGGSSSYSAISLWDSKQSDRLRPIFALMLRRSSGHHPLLAGALRERAVVWRS